MESAGGNSEEGEWDERSKEGSPASWPMDDGESFEWASVSRI